MDIFQWQPRIEEISSSPIKKWSSIKNYYETPSAKSGVVSMLSGQRKIKV